MKRESSQILVMITVVIIVAGFASGVNACIDAKFIWEPYTPSVDELVTFNASISTCNWNGTNNTTIPIISYEWDFGDGSTDEGELVTHIYTKRGTYDVTLTITDAGGDPPNDMFTIPLTIKSGSSNNEDSGGFLWWIVPLVVAAGIGIALPIYFIKLRKPKQAPEINT